MSLCNSWSLEQTWCAGRLGRIWVAGTDNLGLAALLQEAQAPRPGEKEQLLGVAVTSNSEVPAELTDTIRSNLNDWFFWSGENSTDIM